MSLEIKGRITEISNLITVGTFTKKELIIETSETYPQTLCIEFGKEKADLLNGLRTGQDVTVSTNLRGSKWVSPQGQTKYFTSLSGWRIASETATKPQTPQAPPQPQQSSPALAFELDDDGAPF